MGIIEWAQRRETPLQRRVFVMLKAASRYNVPVIPGLHHALLAERRFRKGPLRLLASKIYKEPLLRLQCESVGRDLLILEEMPKIIGNLRARLGAQVTLGGQQTWIAAGSGTAKTLEIGDDTGIGHRTELIVGESIKIGSHVMIANRVSMMGFDGHPLDPYARVRNDPPGPEGIGRITIGDYAWIGSDVTIMKNVTIGRGAVVSARSVVKFNVPDLTVVAGNPAKAVWQIQAPEGWEPSVKDSPSLKRPAV